MSWGKFFVLQLVNLRNFLAGKKTYIIAAATILYSLGIKNHWWGSDPEIWGLLGSSAAITVRVAVTRMMKQFLDDFTAASSTPVQPGQKLFGPQ